ncbi:ABC transporter permease [Paracoccus cavernae]|uniref:ABC transporter permease n=1 Tax=Paracoccus cavernae TaxID=1571207 RepID=UPI00362E976A
MAFRVPKKLRNASLMIGALITITIILLAIFAPLVATHPIEKMDMTNRFSGPSWQHWLGTDNFGRDLWSRLVFGARISLTIALTAVTISALIGVAVGLIAGYFGGWVDLILMRITDIFLGFPAIVLALAIVAALGPGIMNVSVAIIVVAWTEYARVVRATTLVLREQVYVQAAQSIGASHARILFREILPNALGPIIVLVSIGLGTAILSDPRSAFWASACRRRRRPGAGRCLTAPASSATSRGCRSSRGRRSWSRCWASTFSAMVCAMCLTPPTVAWRQQIQITKD